MTVDTMLLISNHFRYIQVILFHLTKENHISILLSTEKWNSQHILSMLQMFSQLRSSFFKVNTLEFVNLMEALYENE